MNTLFLIQVLSDPIMSNETLSSGFWWRDERVAQEEAGPTAVLQHLSHAEHLSAVEGGSRSLSRRDIARKVTAEF